MQALDTSPLTAKIPRREVRTFWRRFRGRPGVRDPRRGVRYAVIVLGAVVVPIGLLAMATGVSQELEEGAPDMAGQLAGMSAVILLFIVAGVVLAWTAARLRARRLSRREYFRLALFADANGLLYIPGTHDGSYLDPWAQTDRVQVSEILRTRSGQIVEFANHERTAVIAGSRSTTFGGHAATRLGTAMPHIRLESQRLRRIGAAAAKRAQRLSLEGDFDRHFQLLCPQGYERDALYLFPPDVMAVLVDHVADFDVELIDDWVFLTSPRDVVTLDPQRWQAITTAMGAIVGKIGQWERWRDDRVPHSRLEALGTVAKAGRRLRLGAGAGTIIAVLAGSVFLSLVILANAVG